MLEPEDVKWAIANAPSTAIVPYVPMPKGSDTISTRESDGFTYILRRREASVVLTVLGKSITLSKVVREPKRRPYRYSIDRGFAKLKHAIKDLYALVALRESVSKACESYTTFNTGGDRKRQAELIRLARKVGRIPGREGDMYSRMTPRTCIAILDMIKERKAQGGCP
jgi:hypothetical protein